MATLGYPGDDAITPTPPYPYNPMVMDIASRTKVQRSRTWKSDRTLVFITVGQSLLANYIGGEKLTGPENLLQVNLMDGALYVAQDPLLGVDTFTPDPGSNSNVAIRIGRLFLATGRYDRVIVLPIAVGSTPVQAWSPGGLFNSRIVVAAARLRALGLTPTFVAWEQGTSNSGYTPASEYTTNLLGVIQTFRDNGVTCPLFVAQDSWVSGVIDLPVRLGQRSTWNPEAGVYPGPDIDLVTSRRDTAHPTQAGGIKQAQLWFDAVNPKLVELAAPPVAVAQKKTPSGVPAVAAMPAANDKILVYVQGPAGPPGPAGSGATYVYQQTAPAAVWTINHNLGVRPDVSITNTGGIEILGDVQHVSLNQLTVTFATPVAGTAICTS